MTTTVTNTTSTANMMPARSWLARVTSATFRRWGARLGLVWIGIVAFGAVFAPFIANSRPYLIKMDGKWSSPLLAGLTAVDVTLLVAALTAGVLLGLRRVRSRTRWLIFLGVVAGTFAVGYVWIKPAKVVVYEQYREAQRAGRVEYVLNAPLPYSPTDRLRDEFLADRPHPRAPDARHWMGTERNGADVLSRLIHACRIAMSVGFIATGIAMIIGVIVGGLMGYFAGWVDLIGMRLVEVFAAVPTMFLILTFVAFYGRDLYLIMAIIGLTGWVGDARFVRAEFLRLRQMDFVQAARAAGLPLYSILFKHMLPNGMAPLLVFASFGIASAILSEATLSFLGLGVVDEASWGELLNQALAATGSFNWWLASYPGLAIFLTVFAYNLIGEALRDAVDPKTADKN